MVLVLSFVVLAIMMTPSLLEGIMDRVPDALLDKKIFVGIYAVLLCAVLYPVFIATTTQSGTCTDCLKDCKSQYPEQVDQDACTQGCASKYESEDCAAPQQ